LIETSYGETKQGNKYIYIYQCCYYFCPQHTCKKSCKISNLTQNWTWKTIVVAKQEEKHKKDEKDAHLLSPLGFLTRGRGEKIKYEMKLCNSSLNFCVAQVAEELCKRADEKARKRSLEGMKVD
jgi:hypothetical protein